MLLVFFTELRRASLSKFLRLLGVSMLFSLGSSVLSGLGCLHLTLSLSDHAFAPEMDP